jgi:hypothetical protein
MLHGEIRVNGMTIGEWSAQRASHLDETPGPDTVVTYDCMVRQDSTLEGNPAILERFQVEHRFGNGALALAADVLCDGEALAAQRT